MKETALIAGWLALAVVATWLAADDRDDPTPPPTTEVTATFEVIE